uniref:Uncharacterized protein n=1 Tax=Megaselia scalaris TaxID=36166 RepID=T1GRZ9_MEGSC
MLLILDHYYSVPRPVFQTTKKSYINNKQTEEEVITPQHEEIVNYIHESWSMIVADNPYDKKASDSNNNSATDVSEAQNQVNSSLYCTEPPSPLLNNFKPFDF